jgi:hypothetical protein
VLRFDEFESIDYNPATIAMTGTAVMATQENASDFVLRSVPNQLLKPINQV